MKTVSKLVAVAALTLGAASAANAGTTSINFESSADKSIKKLGSFSGTATYDDASGLLTITINNTSTASGARLTGLAFNIAGDGAAAYRDGDVAGTRADEDSFDDARRRKGNRLVKARPVGSFEAGAGLNGKFNPPGRKLANRAGIAAGDSHAFTFDVTGGGGLTAADFVGGDLGLVAAFRGRKADKVGSSIVLGSGTTTPGNNAGDEGNPPIIDVPEIDPPGGVIIPPINTGGDNDPVNGPGIGGANDSGNPTTAVPLPPAAIPAVATFAMLALPRLKRKLRELV
jgi:hypothetical protein